MLEKTLQPKTPSAPAKTELPQNHHEAWRPRTYADLQLNTNPFEDFGYGRGSALSNVSVDQPTEIRDATKDTAPLQGSKDISDDDYLDDGI